MNKSDLVKKVAEATELSQKDAGAAVNAFLEAVKEALRGAEKVTLVGFGTFGVKERKGRKGKHPQTRKTIKIPAKIVPYFNSGKELKEAATASGKKAAPKKASKKK